MILLLAQCAQAAPREAPEKAEGVHLPVAVSETKGTDVENHLVIGPFQIKPGEDIDKIDYLKRVGLGEDIASVDEFSEKIKAAGIREGANPVHPGWFAMNERRQFVDFDYVFGQPESKEKGGMVAYAAFNVTSDKKSRTRILLGCAGAPKVFVNGKPVLITKRVRRLFVYDLSVTFPLDIGNNLVVIKIPKQDTLWGFKTHLSLLWKEYVPASLAAQAPLEKFILQKNLFSSFDEPATVAPRGLGVLPFVKYQGCVYAIGGRRMGIIANNKVQWDKAVAQTGPHKLVLEVDNMVYYEKLLVGNPESELCGTISEIDMLPARLREHGGFPALRARLDRLASEFEHPPARQPGGDLLNAVGGRHWMRRLVHELWITREALARVRGGVEPFAHVTGLHLNGFVSKIDESQQCHRMYVPDEYAKDGKPMPLAVVLPTPVSAAKPFVESAFLNDHHLADRMAKLARRHGVILLWPGYHNQPTGLPMENAHLAEVLEAVGQNYNYDRKRVVLMSMCGGVPLAFNACSAWPGRFAGIALLNPEFTLDQNMPRNLVRVFSREKDFRDWFLQQDRMDAFLKRKTPDVFIINDGGNEPGHGDLKTSKAFVAKAGRAGAPVRFETPPRREAAHLGAWEDLMEWAARQRSETGWEDGVPRAGRRESVQEALTEKFWVVRGTEGSDEESAANAAIAKAVLAGWRKTHFAPCRVVMDSELAEEEMRNSNLVLIGSARTNAVWRELDEGLGLGVKITGDGVALGERSWFGGDAVIQAVVRHPKNSARRIVVIGGQGMSPESFGTLNLSRDGWFRHAVWGEGEGGAELRDAGN
jgi:hypothetical protein